MSSGKSSPATIARKKCRHQRRALLRECVDRSLSRVPSAAEVLCRSGLLRVSILNSFFFVVLRHCHGSLSWGSVRLLQISRHLTLLQGSITLSLLSQRLGQCGRNHTVCLQLFVSPRCTLISVSSAIVSSCCLGLQYVRHPNLHLALPPA